ncbi:MAG: hydrogenase expression/formation protein HypE [Sedimentisphaerales bacterium]|nr:hydrogenase expression/formation protein HypE [Sedimentisphaerales bacterium]
MNDRVILAHGGGGELTKRLIAEHIMPRLGNEVLNPLTDGALLDAPTNRLCFTTDAYVVQPLEFPGGNIGHLAVAGTVNDLAVMGATPKWLSLALVLEEGLEFAVLDRILDAIAATARDAGVVIATGDTKVIEARGPAGMTLTTAGVGVLRPGTNLDACRIKPGDFIIVNGAIAEHGLAVMSAREGLAFQTQLQSDVAPLNGLIAAMLDTGADIKFFRDATRGGLAGLVADLAEETGLTVELRENDIPLTPAARHIAELLGLDPLTVANEGKCVAVVAARDAEKILAACRNHPLGRAAAVIGQITPGRPLAELITRAGGRRIIQRPYGEELPRIC